MSNSDDFDEVVAEYKQIFYDWIGNLVRSMDHGGSDLSMAAICQALEELSVELDPLMLDSADYDNFLRELGEEQ